MLRVFFIMTLLFSGIAAGIVLGGSPAVAERSPATGINSAHDAYLSGDLSFAHMTTGTLQAHASLVDPGCSPHPGSSNGSGGGHLCHVHCGLQQDSKFNFMRGAPLNCAPALTSKLDGDVTSKLLRPPISLT